MPAGSDMHFRSAEAQGSDTLAGSYMHKYKVKNRVTGAAGN
jgi:hypothetical protein